MSAETVDMLYVRQDTKIEPLVCGWYAWPHLVSPLQLALNIAFRQLPVLRSFIANPAVHAAAAKDPQFLCAPFIQLQERERDAIMRLLRDTTQRAAQLIQLAEDWVKFDRQLRETANGFNLDDYYARLPPSMSGLVELTYDLSQRPMLRFLEELLDEDAFGSAVTQAISFCSGPETERDFFLNTPRLDADDRLIVDAPFASTCFDLISAARIKPVDFAALVQSLAIPEANQPRLREYFTTRQPLRNQPEYHGDAVRVRYFGHACVLVQTDEVSILVDPVVAWEPDAASNRLTFSDLPDFIDYVFLTHNHQDHFAPEVFLQLRGRIGRVLVPRNNAHNAADPNMGIALRNLGFTAVDVLDPMQTIDIAGGALTSLPFFGEHAALSISSKHGMYLQVKGRRLMFLADADCVDRMLYRRIAATLGKADVLFIGMECDGAPLTWLYGPYLAGAVSKKNDESRRLSGSDSARAWAVAEEVGCSSAYVYAMGQEPWLKHLLGLQYAPDSKQIVESDKFVARCRAAGIPAERLYGCREMLF